MAHETGAHEEHHPGARQYVIVAVILAVLTGIEVYAFTLDSLTSALVVWVLLGLSLAKFFLVVLFFMHLKFDDNRFAYLFFFPMLVMALIGVALLALFQNLTR